MEKESSKPEHICDCMCHYQRGMLHVRPCCYPCKICGQRIKQGEMEQHLEKSHQAAPEKTGGKG